MWWLYELLLLLGLAFYIPRAFLRRRLPHRGWTMRLGRYPAQVAPRLPQRPSIWLHAVSVGEVLASRPLLEALRAAAPNDPLVLSSITPGGFGLIAESSDARSVAVYFPLDLRGCVTRALNALRPRLLLLVESELWPTVIRLARARGVPVVIVNGRISAKAFSRYKLVRGWLRRTLASVDLFLMQTQADADRALHLGAPPERVRVIGSLKWDASLRARPDPSLVRETAARLGLAPGADVVVAGSTHRGEESALLRAFILLRGTRPAARLIIAPRHLERLAEVEALAAEAGWRVRRLSAAGPEPWDVGLVDTFGQLPRYYGLASAVFIGGSLVPHGGQNPLEATSLGKPVAFGPHMHNFQAIAHELLGHHAAVLVAGPPELAGLLARLLDDPAAAAALGARGQEITERFQGATQRTIDALRPFLQPARSA